MGRVEPTGPAGTAALAPPQHGPARRRSIPRRIALVALVLVVLVLATLTVLTAAAWWSLRSDAGASAVLARVPGLRIEGQQGPLVGGPFAAKRLEFTAGESTVVVDDLHWADVQWRWRPSTSQWVGVTLTQPTAARVTVKLPPSKGPPSPPASLRLPVALSLLDLRIDTLAVTEPAVTMRDIAGRVHLGEDGGRRHRVEALRLTWEQARVAAVGSIDADAPMTVALDLEAEPIDHQAPRPWQGRARVQGPLTRLDATASVQAQARASATVTTPTITSTPTTTPATATATTSTTSTNAKPAAASTMPESLGVDAKTTIEPFSSWPVAALDATLRDLDLAAFAADAPRTRIGGRVELSMPTRDAPLALRATLDNREPGRIDQRRVPIERAVVEARGSFVKNGAVDTHQRLPLERFEIDLHDQAGRITGRGLWDDHRLRLDLDTQSLHPSKLDASLAAMTLGGPLEIDVKGVPSLDDLVAGRAVTPGEIDARIRGRLRGVLRGRSDSHDLPAAAVNVDARIVRADPATAHDGPPGLTITLDNVEAQAAGASAKLAGSASRQGRGPWSLQAKGSFDNVDPLAWYPGPPGSAWREGPHRFGGRVDAAVEWPQATASKDLSKIRSTADAKAESTVDSKGHPKAESKDPAKESSASDWPRLAQQLRGRLDLVLSGSRLSGVPLDGTVSWRNESGPALLRASIDAAGNVFDIDGTIDADHAIDPSSTNRSDRWQLRTQAPRLAALAPLARLHPAIARALPQAGSLQGEASVDGRWPQVASRGKVEARGLRAAVGQGARDVGAWQLDTASIAWQVGTDPQAPLRVDLDAKELVQAPPTSAAPGTPPRRIEALKLLVDGSLASHRIEASAQSPVRPPAWSELLAVDTSGAAREAAPELRSEPRARRDAALRGTSFALRAQGRYTPRRVGAPAESLAGGGSWRLAIDELAARARQGRTVWVEARNLVADVDLAPGPTLAGAKLEPGRLALLGAELGWTQARWSSAFSAANEPDRIDVDAKLEPLRAAPLIDRFFPGFGIGGDLLVGGSLVVRSTAERFTIEGLLDRRGGDLTLTDQGQTQPLGLEILRVALNAQDGTWHFTQAASGTTLGVLGGAQTARVSAATRWPSEATPLEGTMSWRVDNLATLAPWLPPGWRATGSLAAGATIGGRVGAPEASGKLEGSQLSVRNLLEGVDWHDGDLRVALRGQGATIERCVFRAGTGELQLDGNASFGPQGTATLALQARQFQMLGRVDRRIVASGEARATIRRDEMQLDSRFAVDEGVVDLRRRDAPSLDSDVSIVRAADAVRGKTRRSSDGNNVSQGSTTGGNTDGNSSGNNGIDNDRDDAAAIDEGDDVGGTDKGSLAAARRGPLAKTRLNLVLDLGRQLRLVGRGLDTRLAGTLTVTSPANRVAVAGSVQAEDGTYKAYGQNLVIRRGIVRFVGPVEDPRLDIVAGRDNLDVEVGVAITGTAQNPRVRLVSEPEMSDVDKLSWLMLGRAPDGLARADTALLQRAALAIWAGEEGSPSDSLLQTLGIDELSVRQTESGDVRDTVVRVGKQISRRWYVGYERGVNASTGTWQVIYRLAQRLIVRAQGGDDNSLDVIWSWRW